jgi:hypothetical protein
MAIALDLIRTESGYPLTPAGSYIRLPWDDSPEFPVSVEQAPVITVTPPTTDGVRLQWSPDTGLTNRCDVWVEIDVTSSSKGVAYMKVNWKDGVTDTIQTFGMTTFRMVVTHSYFTNPLALGDPILVQTYDKTDTLIESDTLAGTITLSTLWRIHQCRIERFKGSESYAHPSERWVHDWIPYDDASLDFYDADAYTGWNWGYRLWLREVDDQDRPGLTMVPSSWVETGTGEGS